MGLAIVYAACQLPYCIICIRRFSTNSIATRVYQGHRVDTALEFRYFIQWRLPTCPVTPNTLMVCDVCTPSETGVTCRCVSRLVMCLQPCCDLRTHPERVMLVWCMCCQTKCVQLKSADPADTVHSRTREMPIVFLYLMGGRAGTRANVITWHQCHLLEGWGA